MAQEEASANEAPAITAHTTLPTEAADTGPVITALMQHIIDKHASSSGTGAGNGKTPRLAATGISAEGGTVASTSSRASLPRGTGRTTLQPGASSGKVRISNSDLVVKFLFNIL